MPRKSNQRFGDEEEGAPPPAENPPSGWKAKLKARTAEPATPMAGGSTAATADDEGLGTDFQARRSERKARRAKMQAELGVEQELVAAPSPRPIPSVIAAVAPGIAMSSVNPADTPRNNEDVAIRVENYEVDVDDGRQGLLSDGSQPARSYAPQDMLIGLLAKVLMRVVAIGPWIMIKGISYTLNKWQRLVSPISYALYATGDALDRKMPTVYAIFVWFTSTISLSLHFADVVLCFAVMHILSSHNHKYVSGLLGFLYWVSHYLMGVIMYMEHDRPMDRPVYSGLDVINFLRRQVDVLFYDIQLFASVVHSNIMIEGMTQMVLQGYEEGRVCLHMIINTIPTAIILGVLYDTLNGIQKVDFEDIWTHRSYTHVVYGAFVLAVLNAIEKFIRLSLADPWLHPLNKDGYPLLYMRSSAARLPRALVLDFMFRCNVQLMESEERLTLAPLYDKYVVNSRGEPKPLADGHKAHLLRKVLRTFNADAGRKLSPAEKLARNLDKRILRPDQVITHHCNIVALDASNLNTGVHFSTMLEEVMAEARGFDWLALANNGLKDAAAARIMEGLRCNANGMRVRHLDLSGNNLDQGGAEAVSAYLLQLKCVTSLCLGNNPLGAVGVKALATVLQEDSCLLKLDLSGATVGADGAASLGAMLKTNRCLQSLVMAETKIGTSGVESICKGLLKNPSLTELDLGRTAADDKSAIAIAQMLMSNTVLQRLVLAHTKITDAGAKVLIDALQSNHGLQFIDITGCPMDKQWKKLLGNMLKQGAAA